MKNPKALTRSQKEKLTKKHLDASEYVVIEQDNYTFTVQKKSKLKTDEDIITFNK